MALYAKNLTMLGKNKRGVRYAYDVAYDILTRRLRALFQTFGGGDSKRKEMNKTKEKGAGRVSVIRFSTARNRCYSKFKIVPKHEDNPQALFTGVAAAIECVSVLPPRMDANDNIRYTSCS